MSLVDVAGHGTRFNTQSDIPRAVSLDTHSEIHRAIAVQAIEEHHIRASPLSQMGEPIEDVIE